MARISVWKVQFETGGSSYSAFIGISGGSPSDHKTPSVKDSLQTALTNNLANILTALGVTGAGGSASVKDFTHASAPDVWT